METLWFVLLGAVMGTFSGLLGLGGGVIAIPGLVLLLGVDMKKATAMSLALIVPVACSGIYRHFSGGTLLLKDIKSIALIAVSGMVFAMAGVYLNKILPVEVIKKIFALFIIFVGVKMLLEKKPEPKPEAKTETAASFMQDDGQGKKTDN